MKEEPRLAPASARRLWVIVGLVFLGLLALGTWADRATGGRWPNLAFEQAAHLFYEQPLLAALRRPSQLILLRVHLAIALGLAAAGCLATLWLGRHGARLWWVFVCAYVLRAMVWIAGGNLPLVPGDECHYLEVATSVYRGEGPVKHYVESYFIDYRAIRAGKGALDDWATPLYAYVLAAAFRLARIEPGRSLEETVAVARWVSFVCNLLTLPALYGLARRRIGPDVALGATAALAILPVHAIYAGMALRESLVALAAVLAVWCLTEIWNTAALARWGWACAAGIASGSAILARNTSLALIGACGLYGLLIHGKRALGPLLLAGVITLAIIAPWAWVTYQEYGEPFYTYTKFFQYNFSWTVHHYDKGIMRAAEFYTWANAPEILRVKVKSLAIIAVYSTMIVSAPLVLGFVRGLASAPGETNPQARDLGRLVAWLFLVFVLATIANIADITQVAQLGRYYLPVFVLALPTAVAGMRDWLERSVAVPARPWVCALVIPLLWSDPTWAYDASWLVKPYQLHWPALREAGDWVRSHPSEVPSDARVLTWFPWEFRVASDRTTVLFPRSYYRLHIMRAIEDYHVTHVLWGSFEPPPNSDPELWGRYLEQLRLGIGLVEENEVYRTRATGPRGFYPVRLYRLRGNAP
jgi:hypothetical protein